MYIYIYDLSFSTTKKTFRVFFEGLVKVKKLPDVHQSPKK